MDAKNKSKIETGSENGKAGVREKFKYNLAVHIKVTRSLN